MTEAIHSPLGASGAERWMECPGSVSLLKRLDIPEPTDEPDWTREGVALHEAAALCLARGVDSWEIVGETIHNTVMTVDMCDAIQVYIDRVRPLMHGHHAKDYFIEQHLAVPETHPDMFGTVDFGALVHVGTEVTWCSPGILKALVEAGKFLDVTDLKGGIGIIVEPDENPQMKYYAYMLLVRHFSTLPDETPVRLTIVQPRAFHPVSRVRDWWTTAGEIRQWVAEELVPAMEATAFEGGNLDAGPWCRFCPAKLVCPLLTGLFRAAAMTDPKEIVALDDETISREYRYTDAVKFYIKALEEETFKRLSRGSVMADAKLVSKRANRVFVSNVGEVPVEAAIKERFGADAYTKPELKSPAELEKLSPAAAAFVKEYAYLPDNGLTVALTSDKRAGVKIARAAEVFSAFVEGKPEG